MADRSGQASGPAAAMNMPEIVDMAESKDTQEPSMEEILSSIRKIIDDEDQESPEDEIVKAAKPDLDSDDTLEDDDVLELAEISEEGAAEEVLELGDIDEPQEQRPAPAKEIEAPAASVETIDDAHDRFEDANELEPEFEASSIASVVRDRIETGDLVSDSTASAAASAFARIKEIQTRRPLEKAPFAIEGGDKSLEVFVADMLKPMLKDWLDRNLPSIVERAVEEEVKKLARRAELM